MARPVDREAVFHPEFRQDLRYWVETDRKAALRIFELMEAVLRDPSAGIGKPEPLSMRWQAAGREESRRNIAWCTASPKEELIFFKSAITTNPAPNSRP